MKYNEIICIGSSHTQGGGLNPNRDKDIIDWYLKNKGIKVSDITHSYPAILENKIGIKTTNLGKCGTGIEYMIRMCEEQLEKEDCSNKLFVFERSIWGRAELFDPKDGNYIVANWGHRNGEDPSDGFESYLTQNYNREFTNSHLIFDNEWDYTQNKCQYKYDAFLTRFLDEDTLLKNLDRQLLNLFYKLDSLKIPFVLFNAERWYLHKIEENPIIKKNEITLKWNDNGKIQTVHLWDYLDKKKISIQHETNSIHKDGHPGVLGHQHIADLIIEKII
tara:strand:+ start:21504 stop:22331 length:828 start_codon:yes stop_codon:yes gene_type:complete